MKEPSQFTLMRQKRFAPLFYTQFLGALNDNVFRYALSVLIAFQLTSGSVLSPDTLINLALLLFILPFFLFSATAGQIADKYEKSALIRRVKILEICIMAGAAIAFYFSSVWALMALLFFMGTQSTFFGPLKYSILPQHLRDDELVGGNGLIEMGTFLAILVGTMLGGILVSFDAGRQVIAITLIAVAALGYYASRRIPEAEAVDPNLVVSLNPISETLEILKFTMRNRTVFLSILGISWFWFLGAIYLAQLPNYTKLALGGSEEVVTLLLATFIIGSGTGSLLCERLSGRMVELGLVPMAAAGLTAAGIDLYFANLSFTPPEGGMARDFIVAGGSFRIIIDLFAMGAFGGFFVVPLYALIQQRSERAHLSRIIAGNNILNALFIVVSAMMAIAVLGAGRSIPELLLITAVLNALVAAYIFTLVPEFLMRFIVWILIHTMYRVKKNSLERIPDEGPAVLVCNHVSFVDALIIAGCVPRPVRFVMHHRIFKIPVLSFVFRTARAIPIASRSEDPGMLERAYDSIAAELEAGNLICIFPEGRITSTGKINRFRKGIEQITARTPVPVIPMALRGLWGSFFSRKRGRAMQSLPRRFWSRIALVAGPPMSPHEATAESLQHAVAALRGDEK